MTQAGKLSVTPELLAQALRLPEGTRIEFAAYDPRRKMIVLHVAGHEGLPPCGEGCVPGPVSAEFADGEFVKWQW